MDYSILTVVPRKIAEHLREVYRYYQKRGWNYQQYIACLDPLDEGHGRTPYSLTSEKYGKFLSTFLSSGMRISKWKTAIYPSV